MSENITKAINADDQKKQAIKEQLEQIKNVSRIVGNTITLINEHEVKPSYFDAVKEILLFLEGNHKQLLAQVSQLEALVPKEEKKEEPKLEVLEAEIVPGPEGAR
jgi:hypothetical protein